MIFAIDFLKFRFPDRGRFLRFEGGGAQDRETHSFLVVSSSFRTARGSQGRAERRGRASLDGEGRSEKMGEERMGDTWDTSSKVYARAYPIPLSRARRI